MERIDQREIVHAGRSFTVVVEPDHDATPYEADCYTPEDITAWRRDAWRYVVVTVRDGDDVLDQLGAVEYGQLGDRYIGTDEIVTTHPVPDMLADIA